MSAIMSISILIAILTCVAAELCQIRNANDLANAKDCTELELYANDKVMKSPLLFDKIKTATTYRHFELNGTELEKISEAKELLLPKGSTVTILDNANLRELPKFNIADGNAIKLSVIGNPKLDTRQLLMECEKKDCSQDTLNNIQPPFSCRAITPLPRSCRIVFGTLPLHLYHYSWGTIETLYGTITLENSRLKRGPTLEKLEHVIQLKNTPVLIVKNNSKLEEIDSLLDVNYIIIDDKGVSPVQIEKNPNLCVSVYRAAHGFAMKYMKNVERCAYRHKMAEVSENRKARGFDEGATKTVTTGNEDGPRTTETTPGNTETAEAPWLETDAGDRSLTMVTVDQIIDENMTTITASEKVETKETLVGTIEGEINGTTQSVTNVKKQGGAKGFFEKILPRSGKQAINLIPSIFLLFLRIV